MLVTLRLSQSDVEYLIRVLCDHEEMTPRGPRIAPRALVLADALQCELDGTQADED